MPASETAVRTARPRMLDQLDKLDTRLHHVRHICAFISDVACAAAPGAQTDSVKADDLAATFTWVADQVDAALEVDLQPIRDDVSRSPAFQQWQCDGLRGSGRESAIDTLRRIERMAVAGEAGIATVARDAIRTLTGAPS